MSDIARALGFILLGIALFPLAVLAVVFYMLVATFGDPAQHLWQWWQWKRGKRSKPPPPIPSDY